METVLGQIIVLAIVGVVGFVALKLFGKNKKVSIPFTKEAFTKKSTFWDDGETMICSSWNVSVLSPESGKALQTVPICIPSEDYFTIGRDKKCTLRLNDKTVSAYHAYFTKSDDGEYILRDSDSLNGIMCVEGNKERMYDELPLEDGLVCFLGNTPLGFSHNDSRNEFQFHNNKRKTVAREDKPHDNTKEYCRQAKLE